MTLCNVKGVIVKKNSKTFTKGKVFAHFVYSNQYFIKKKITPFTNDKIS